PTATPTPPAQRSAPPRRPRERGRTPLFDQYDEQDRPRAANE
ncbi:membrane protein, partial [Streptomyces sp. 150FB]